MNNAQLINYLGRGLVLVKRERGWLRKPDEFLMFPGDTLTQVPVKKPKRFGRLYLLWCRIAPEFWRSHKRKRSHLAFLRKNMASLGDVKSFFSRVVMLSEKKTRWDFDPNDQTYRPPVKDYNEVRHERYASLHGILVAAFKESAARSEVVVDIANAKGPDNAPKEIKQ